jgi:hypothetical protein
MHLFKEIASLCGQQNIAMSHHASSVRSYIIIKVT